MKINDPKLLYFKVDFFSSVIREILNDCVVDSHISALILSMCCIDYMGIPLSGNKTNTRKEFKQFLNDYMSEANKDYLDTAIQDIIYAIRCSLVHTFGESDALVKHNLKPVFIYGNHTEKEHLKIFDDNEPEFHLSISQFVSEVIAGVEKYFRENNDHNLFIEWYKKLIIVSGYANPMIKLTCVKNNNIIYKNIHGVISMLDDDPIISYSELARQINDKLLFIYNNKGIPRGENVSGIYDKEYNEYVKKDIIPFLHDYKRKIPKNEFRESLINVFQNYNDEIDTRIKVLFSHFTCNADINHIGEQVFILEVKELDNFYKIQFSGMRIVINDYYEDILNFTSEPDFYENQDFNGMMEYFKFLIVDSLVLVADCERHHKIVPSREIGKQNIIKGNDSFRSSINLKLNGIAWDSLSSFNASVFLIRQAIELKIKNALGINFILDQNGAMRKIPSDRLMDFFFDNNKIELPDVKKSIVRKIHNWTQYFVHGGYVLNIWQIDIAHTLLKPLFMSGEKGGTLSIYGGVKIQREYYDGQFKKDLEEYIKTTFKNGEENQFTIVTMDPEALL